jgi:hypothetical protein
MNKSELEQKAGQLARQLDDVREHFNVITREYEALLEARQGQVVATAQQLREPVSAVLDGLQKTARPRWIPVAALAVGVLLVPLAMLRWRSRATELRETIAQEVRKATGTARAHVLGDTEALGGKAEWQVNWLPDRARAVTDTLAANIRRATE